MKRVYRLALRLLPVTLRDKHGSAMEALFMHELEQARGRGRLQVAHVGAAGVWDVMKRAVYERVRPAPDVSGSQLTTGQLLRQLAASFTIALSGLTVSLLFLFSSRQLSALSARGASAATIAKFVLLAVPFTAAMTIPMAVFLSVLHEFTRLGANGTLAAARSVHHGVRRLVVTVLAAAVGVAALALVVTAEIVPPANQRLTAVLSGGAAAHTDRTMTIPELREAARHIRPGTEAAAAYDVEIQKKLALPAACLVLALVGMAIAFRFPRGGLLLVAGASVAVFGAYYVLIVMGETLAERLVVSAVVGMWGANVLLLTTAMLVVWRRNGSRLVSNAP